MDQHYDVQTVADKLDLHPQTIYRWIDKGKLEAVKLGEALRIPEPALDEFLEERRTDKEE